MFLLEFHCTRKKIKLFNFIPFGNDKRQQLFKYDTQFVNTQLFD